MRGDARFDWPKQAWWQDLHDPQLDQLLALALADNPGVHVAQARLRQARALAGLAGKNTGGRVDAGVPLERELYSEHGSAPAALAGKYAWRNQATLSASYDLDLWGRNRHALAAALDEVQLAGAEVQMARLALAGRGGRAPGQRGQGRVLSEYQPAHLYRLAIDV